MLTEDNVLSRGYHHGLQVAGDAFLRWAPANDEPFIYEFNEGTGINEKSWFTSRDSLASQPIPAPVHPA